MRQLGGQTLSLNHTDLQIGRGESIADTARVLSRYVDAILIRANAHSTLLELARHATVPVINGLTDRSHPCQVIADIVTFEERLGPIKGRLIAWVGDGNNVAASWMHAAVRFGFELRKTLSTGWRGRRALCLSEAMPRKRRAVPTAS
jgi:ornithine carbamoyltransferase